MSVHARLYEFADRYRIALSEGQPITEHDKPLLTELINSCIPHIPSHLHAEIYTSTCCFAVVRAKNESFNIHVAFTNHNVLIKFKMRSPCGGWCSFYKLKDDTIREKLIISDVKDELHSPAGFEDWYIVSSKERDQLLMPPPPPCPRAPNKSQKKL